MTQFSEMPIESSDANNLRLDTVQSYVIVDATSTNYELHNIEAVYLANFLMQHVDYIFTHRYRFL